MATIRDIREMAGTEVKINISVEPMGDLHMSGYDFECVFYPYTGGRENMKKSVTLRKEQMIEINDDNYVAIVDTGVLGAGEIMCRLTAYIPDLDMANNLRTEIVTLPTGITMY